MNGKPYVSSSTIDKEGMLSMFGRPEHDVVSMLFFLFEKQKIKIKEEKPAGEMLSGLFTNGSICYQRTLRVSESDEQDPGGHHLNHPEQDGGFFVLVYTTIQKYLLLY